MRRGVTFAATAVTAFTLVVLASVAYAYRVMAASRTTQVEASAPQVSPGLAVTSTTNAQPQISPKDAAALASALLQRTDAFSVELSDWNGVPAFKVTFSSGDLAYMSLDGQLLASVPVTTHLAASGGGGGHGTGQRASLSQDGSDDQAHEIEHEQEHETETEGG